MASKKITEIQEEHDSLMRVIFGDEETGEKGMKKKLDEIHEILVQLNGVGWFLKWIIIVCGALAALKVWMIK